MILSDTKMHQLNLFSTPVWFYNVPNFVELNYQLTISAKKNEIDLDYFHIDNDGVRELKSIVVDFVRKALREYYPNVSGFEIKISGRQNFLPPLACDTIHHHLDYNLVCVYYLKVPKKSGDLLLLDPRGSVLWDDPNICTTQAGKSDIDIACEQGRVTPKLFRPFHRIRPLEGSMVLHPGYLNHQVETNLSDEDRISIVMDIKIYYRFSVS